MLNFMFVLSLEKKATKIYCIWPFSVGSQIFISSNRNQWRS